MTQEYINIRVLKIMQEITIDNNVVDSEYKIVILNLQKRVAREYSLLYPAESKQIYLRKWNDYAKSNNNGVIVRPLKDPDGELFTLSQFSSSVRSDNGDKAKYVEEIIREPVLGVFSFSFKKNQNDETYDRVINNISSRDNNKRYEAAKYGLFSFDRENPELFQHYRNDGKVELYVYPGNVKIVDADDLHNKSSYYWYIKYVKWVNPLLEIYGENDDKDGFWETYFYYLAYKVLSESGTGTEIQLKNLLEKVQLQMQTVSPKHYK